MSLLSTLEKSVTSSELCNGHMREGCTSSSTSTGTFSVSKRVAGVSRTELTLLPAFRIPGSQNGEIHSGHLTEQAAFFNNPVNIGRADDTVAAILSWLGNNPYRSVVSGLEGSSAFSPRIQQLLILSDSR